MKNLKIESTLDKGLDKHYSVSVPYSNITTHIDKRALELQKTYKQDGFRTGKVPTKIIIEKNELALMSDASEKIVNEVLQKIIKDNKLQIAVQPSVEIKKFNKNEDFEFTIALEIFPVVPDTKLEKISLEEDKIKISEEDVMESLDRILGSHKDLKKQDKEYKAKKGDTVKIDFLGKIKGVPFEGGEAKGHTLELGSKSFIEGFEDQLIGTKAGDKKVVKVTFPKNYHAHLAGKKAEFDVEVHEVLTGEKPELTDKFVKEKVGMDSVEKLKENIKKQITDVYKNITKENLKMDLIAALQKEISFDVPKGLVEEQFKNLWKTTEEEIKKNPNKFKDDKEKKKAETEARKEAEKMVRVGIFFSEFGKKNNLKISNDEITNEIAKRASQYPGQEQMFLDYYKNNQDAMSSLTGALLETKVIEKILEKAKIKTKELSVKEFQKKQDKKAKKK